MAFYKGKFYSKQELNQLLGNIGAVVDVRLIEYQDGFTKGLRAYDVINGDLRFTVLIDKCMDIGDFYFKSTPMHFLAKPGQVNGNWWYDGPNAPRSISGGMLFTCGLSNVGPIQSLPNGQTQPQHGFIRNTPAESHGVRTYWKDDEYYMELTGVMREASLFGTNLVLRRTITTKFGDSSVQIQDQIENESSQDNIPLMLMYHCNVGFPLLDETAVLEIDPYETKTRDSVAEDGMKTESFIKFGPPEIIYAEQVFYHKLKSNEHQCTATLYNPSHRIALSIQYDDSELPNLIQWKCKNAGNYVMGIEPSNCYPEGVHIESANGTVRYMSAGEIIQTGIRIEINTRS